MANNNDIPIYGALRSKTGEGKAAYASQIYDEARGKFQDEINNETANDGLVSAKVEQTFTDAEKQQARTNIGAYTKPSGGIPDTDLAISVRNSIYKADTAYQKPMNGIPAYDIYNGKYVEDTCKTVNEKYFTMEDYNAAYIDQYLTFEFLDEGSLGFEYVNISGIAAPGIPWYYRPEAGYSVMPEGYFDPQNPDHIDDDDFLHLWYSIDNGKTWAILGGSITVGAGTQVRVKGSLATTGTMHLGHFNISQGRCVVSGVLNSILYGNTAELCKKYGVRMDLLPQGVTAEQAISYAEHPSSYYNLSPLWALYYDHIFSNNDLIVDARHLVISPIMTEGCYQDAFYTCHNLKYAPILQPSSVPTACFNYLYCNCYSLERVILLWIPSIDDNIESVKYSSFANWCDYVGYNLEMGYGTVFVKSHKVPAGVLNTLSIECAGGTIDDTNLCEFGKKEEIMPLSEEYRVSQQDSAFVLDCKVNTSYRIATNSSYPNVIINLPIPSDENVVSSIVVVVYNILGNITIQCDNDFGGRGVQFYDSYKIESGNYYEINCSYVGWTWIVGAARILDS